MGQSSFEPRQAAAAARKAVDHLIGLQKPAGDWEGEMVWCTMILAQAVIVRFVVNRPYSEAEKQQVIKHFAVSQGADGSGLCLLHHARLRRPAPFGVAGQ
jgi:hypothetical protein